MMLEDDVQVAELVGEVIDFAVQAQVRTRHGIQVDSSLVFDDVLTEAVEQNRLRPSSKSARHSPLIHSPSAAFSCCVSLRKPLFWCFCVSFQAASLVRNRRRFVGEGFDRFFGAAAGSLAGLALVLRRELVAFDVSRSSGS